MPGSWAHLARRFFWSLRVVPLDDHERAEVERLLTPPVAARFFDQPDADQRHGLDAAGHVRDGGGDAEAVRAALLHDLGKRHARLGVIGRSVASFLARLRLPTPGRLGTYLDHHRLGAEELEELGESPLVVGFARHHHGRRPDSITAEVWDLLVHADEVVGDGGSGR